MQSPAQILASLPAAQREAELAKLSPAARAELRWRWQFWARSNQMEPDGQWRTWAAIAGRGFGKTRLGAEWVRKVACGDTPLTAGRHRRIAIIAETAADARDVLVEGDSGILAVHPSDFRPLYEPSKRRLTWPNGAIGTLYNAVEPDQLRGPQHDAALCDELAKWRYARDTWDQLQFGMRLGEHPQVVVTTTPRPIPVLKEILADQATVITRGATMDNAGNLAPSFMKAIVDRYAGTRLGRQELNAEMLDDVPGALWTGNARCAADQGALHARVVIGVDPRASGGDGDDIGIAIAGLGVDGRGYVLGDWSAISHPWLGRRVSEAFPASRPRGWKTDGVMVEAVLRNGEHADQDGRRQPR